MAWLNRKYALFACLAVLLSLGSLPANAMTTQQEVDRLIARKQAPEGVVFEVVDSDARALEWAVPQVRGYVKQLRAKFPKLDIAVVSHGNEEFALRRDSINDFSALHQQAAALVAEDNVPLHVCERYANMKGVQAESFADFVNVAAAGPTQIRDYQSLGYVLIKVKKARTKV